jgi:hypothetical protein
MSTWILSSSRLANWRYVLPGTILGNCDSLLHRLLENDRQFAERITETLQVLESNGAPGVLSSIKKKVPLCHDTDHFILELN